MKPLPHSTFARRLSTRFDTHDTVWVYWRCNGRDDVSRVRDLSLKGMFIETEEQRAVGTTINLDFLVQEGQIRAEAAVQRVKSGAGLGLKFTAVTPEDGARLTTLTARLCELSRSPLQRPMAPAWPYLLNIEAQSS